MLYTVSCFTADGSERNGRLDTIPVPAGRPLSLPGTCAAGASWTSAVRNSRRSPKARTLRSSTTTRRKSGKPRASARVTAPLPAPSSTSAAAPCAARAIASARYFDDGATNRQRHGIDQPLTDAQGQNIGCRARVPLGPNPGLWSGKPILALHHSGWHRRSATVNLICESTAKGPCAFVQYGTCGPAQLPCSRRARCKATSAAHQPSQALRPGRLRHRFRRPLQRA